MTAAYVRNMLTETSSESLLTATVDRRKEPRLSADGDITILFRGADGELQLKAELLDFSLRGMKIRHQQHQFQEGQKLHIFFTWGEVDTTVMWSSSAGESFETGLQLF